MNTPRTADWPLPETVTQRSAQDVTGLPLIDPADLPGPDRRYLTPVLEGEA